MYRTGGGMLAKAKDSSAVKTGQWVITGGLFIQIFFFGLFVIVTAIFNWRLAAYPTRSSTSRDVPWQKYLAILYIASGLILIRSVFRIVEYIQGQDGVLMDSEIYLYIFDATLMFLTMLIFNIWHPSSIITKEKLAHRFHDPESQDSSYALEGRREDLVTKH
jgi:tellurite resistance protein TehA-like permease